MRVSMNTRKEITKATRKRYQRIMDDENVDSDIKERLKHQYLSINPVTIRKERNCEN